MKAPIEYQSSAKVKIERRPNRSDSQLNASVPMNRPRNKAATKLAKPFRSKCGRREYAGLEQADCHIGREEQIVEFKPAAERQQRYQPPGVARRRHPIEPGCYGDASICGHIISPSIRQRVRAVFAAIV